MQCLLDRISIIDLSCFVLKYIFPVVEIQFALKDECMELLGVGTIKSIGFSKFGLGFGGFCGVLEQLANNFRKFLSFGRKW